MVIGQKLKEIRESKNLSQGDIEERTGLLRCYTSRVENGHTIPAIETPEKYARALEVPLYKLFYDGKRPIRKPNLPAVNNDGALPTQIAAAFAERREIFALVKTGMAFVRMALPPSAGVTHQSRLCESARFRQPKN
jgi:transcriptional regulator with XRE-family HTH domain